MNQQASAFGPEFLLGQAMREEAKIIFALDGQPAPKVDVNSNTWAAVKRFIEEEIASNYMQVLRARSAGHDETQYARGAIDALESLLTLGGKE